ncbi:hypothetical protein [Microcoleus sp. F4-D5]|uniref:hypothetical protein n=1 Tax=Microcoleus sp. F4-D5 TaxID=2818760 RepID=UPI002FD4CECE
MRKYLSSFCQGISSDLENEPIGVAALLLGGNSLNSIAAAVNTLLAELITVISIYFYNLANL